MRLRIISGEFKGRMITVPDSKFIRPMTDRVRETLFNLLENRINFDEIKVLDLYSGSGALGLECLSRGAKEVHFVEKNFKIYKNLRENIQTLGVSENCVVYKMDAEKFSSSFNNPEYHLIIADPPFYKEDIYNVVDKILFNKYLSDDGFMIIERSIQTKNKDIEKFRVEPFKIIGDACLYEIRY